MMRHPVRILAIISYYFGIIDLFYFLNKGRKRIVTFHNVIPEKLLPCGKKIGLVDTEEEFRIKIGEIKKKFKFGVNWNEGTNIVITFDDGYKNQAEIAEKILNEEGNIPAIIFASGRNINNANPTQALIVDLLMHWVELSPDGRYELPDYLYENKYFELEQENRSLIWKNIIWPAFNKDIKSKGEELLSFLSNQYHINELFKSCAEEYLRLRLTGITEDDINYLLSRGWLIGWHTENHYPLSKLSEVELKKEIVGSPQFMHNVIMSYPYGELSSVNSKCIELSYSTFPAAVSNLPEMTKYSCKHFLPRFTLDSNKYILHFELSGLKSFLKTGRLLQK